MSNVSPDLLWLITKDTDCALKRRKNGVGDLTTCHYNPVGIQKPAYSAFANRKHAGITENKSEEGGFNLNHQSRKSNKPEKCFTSTHVVHRKSADVQNFRNFVQHRLGRRDLAAVSIVDLCVGLCDLFFVILDNLK